jgi:hypothetical protein
VGLKDINITPQRDLPLTTPAKIAFPFNSLSFHFPSFFFEENMSLFDIFVHCLPSPLECQLLDDSNLSDMLTAASPARHTVG